MLYAIFDHAKLTITCFPQNDCGVLETILQDMPA